MTYCEKKIVLGFEKNWRLLEQFIQAVKGQNNFMKNNSCDQEKLLKFEAEGREFSNILRSLEQFIQTVKGQNNFW